VLVIDDVQWCDEISEALTIDLIRRLGVEPAPLLLVLVHRPVVESDHVNELIETLNGTYLHHYLALSELSRAEVDTMVAAGRFYLRTRPGQPVFCPGSDRYPA
jgi:predicted ATPase